MAVFFIGAGFGILLCVITIRCKLRRIHIGLGKRFCTITMDIKGAVSAWNELTAYRATDMTPEEIHAMRRDFDVLEKLSRSNPEMFARASGLDMCQVAGLAMYKGLPPR